MRFSAVCNSLLLQYCCSLQELVGLALALVLELELTYLQFRREVEKREEVKKHLDEMFSRAADQEEMVSKVVCLSEQVRESPENFLGDCCADFS